MEKRYDRMILADKISSSFNSGMTGLNNNILVIGPPGSGKSFSITEPQILQTYENSIVVTMTKRKIAEKYAGLMKERGYLVDILDLSRPELSTAGFDPMFYIFNQSDIADLASMIINISQRAGTTRDPYWDDTAVSLLTAEISALIEQWAYQYDGKEAPDAPLPTMSDVLSFHRKLKPDGTDSSGFTVMSFDRIFSELEKKNPKSYAASCWSSVRGLASKTMSCVLSTANVGLSQTFTPQMQELLSKPPLDIADFGERKHALFLITSPVSKSSQYFINILYSIMFKELFGLAEVKEDFKLSVPVHFICDDFATGAKIPQFAEYISIFREAGISFAILIQSVTQLESLYGHGDASTIINNCDRTVYFGGTDADTCTGIARRMDVPASDIQNLPLGKVVVMERGSRPVYADRYPVLSDPEYKKLYGG